MIEIIQNKNQVKEIMYRGGIYMEETRKIPIREVGTKDKEYRKNCVSIRECRISYMSEVPFRIPGKTDSSDCRCAGSYSLWAHTGISLCEILKRSGSAGHKWNGIRN